MLESEFTGSTKIVNYGVEKLRLQQKQKADTVLVLPTNTEADILF